MSMALSASNASRSYVGKYNPSLTKFCQTTGILCDIFSKSSEVYAKALKFPCFLSSSLQGGDCSAICHRFPDDAFRDTVGGGQRDNPGEPLPLPRGVNETSEPLGRRLLVLALALVIYLCVKPERWIEAAMIGDVLERHRDMFSRVGDRALCDRALCDQMVNQIP